MSGGPQFVRLIHCGYKSTIGMDGDIDLPYHYLRIFFFLTKEYSKRQNLKKVCSQVYWHLKLMIHVYNYQ